MYSLRLGALAVFCTLGKGAVGIAHQLPAQALQARKAISPQPAYEEAIIRAIYSMQGLLLVETERALLQVRLTPEATQHFQVGEKIQVQLLPADTREEGR